MSETTAVVEQTPTTEAPAQKETPQVDPGIGTPDVVQPVSTSPKRAVWLEMAKERRDARQQAKTADAPAEVAGEATAEAPADGRARDPKTGQFVPKDTEASAAERPTDEPAEAPPAAGRPTTVRIPLPADHPLRAQGVEHIDVLPEQEEHGRAAVNAFARRKELEAATAREQALIAERNELREKLMRHEAGQAATSKWTQTPEYKAAVERYHEIAETVGQDAASTYWRGVQEDFHKLHDAEYGQRANAVEQAETAQRVQQWTNEAWGHTESVPADIRSLPGFRAWFDETVQDFDHAVAQGRYPHLQTGDDLHTEFRQLFRARLLREPGVIGLLRQADQPSPAAEAARAEQIAREKAEAARLAVEQYKREAADKRRAAPPHPMGSVAGAARGVETVTTPGGEVDTSKMSPTEFKRHLRQGARQQAAALFRR